MIPRVVNVCASGPLTLPATYRTLVVFVPDVIIFH